jgi:hypothetical protein
LICIQNIVGGSLSGRAPGFAPSALVLKVPQGQTFPCRSAMISEVKKRALSLRISEDISKAVGEMCNLERSTSASYLEHFFIR